jgi:membrane fusion protein, multidrug efflux system
MIDQASQASLPAPPTHAALPAPENGKGGVLRTILVVLVVAAAVGGAAWKIHSNAATQTTTNTRMNAAGGGPTPVLITAVVQKTMPIYLTALGTVTPYYSVTVKSRVDGQLISVPVREGQAVKKGQLLAEIDPAPYEAALAQAQGQLVKDQANAKNADAEAARYTALLDAGVVSKESQQSQVSTAGQAAGSIAADNAAIKAAQVNVAYTKILSPIDGIVGLRQVDPGNIVHASDTTGLLLVTQLQPISVIFTLPEDQLPQVLELVRGGKTLTVEAYDRSETTHLATGTLLTLDNSIDPTTGTDKVKAVFPNKDGALFPNQFVNVRLILQQRPNALVVPAAAIQTGSTGSFVYLVKKGMPPAGLAGAGGGRRGGGGGRGAGGAGAGAGGAAPAAGASAGASAPAGAAGAGANRPKADPYYVIAQPVTVDVTEGTQVILASGLNAGDQVVIDGQEKLLNGSRVSPRTQDSTGSGGTKAAGSSTETGPGTAAFGPSGAGPSEPSSGKRGIETGSGVPAGGGHPGGGHHGQGGQGGSVPSPDGQPHEHHRPGSGSGQTGQQP